MLAAGLLMAGASAGVAMHPLTRQLVDQLPGQDNFRCAVHSCQLQPAHAAFRVSVRSCSSAACSWAELMPCAAMHDSQHQLQHGADRAACACRSVICDSHLHVLGADLGSIYALGDAATIAQPRALARAQVGPLQALAA